MNTILITAFCAMGFAMPAMFCAGFYYGFRTAEKALKEKGADIMNIPGAITANSIIHAVTETEEQRRTRILAENVENYGTDIPQKEVM